MSGFSAIDLTKLPSPDVIETLSFEQIMSEMLQDLRQRDAQLTALLESDPVMKLLQVAAYREVLLRARINDACRAVMLSFARGSTLDQLAALYGVLRQLIDTGNAHAIPPIPPRYESDERLRQRTQLSLEGHSTAGPVGSYIYHALAVDSHVKDVDVDSPSPGHVVVTVLSTDNIGIASDELLNAVTNKLNGKSVRPLTDALSVQRATIIRYRVNAELILYDGPDAELVLSAAQTAARHYVTQHHLLGNDITLSGLYAALHKEGVQRVVLRSPTNDIRIANDEAAWCDDLSVSIGGRDE